MTTKDLTIRKVRTATWDDAVIMDCHHKIPQLVSCGCDECRQILRKLTRSLAAYVGTYTEDYETSDAMKKSSLVEISTWAGRAGQHLLAIAPDYEVVGSDDA